MNMKEALPCGVGNAGASIDSCAAYVWTYVLTSGVRVSNALKGEGEEGGYIGWKRCGYVQNGVSGACIV